MISWLLRMPGWVFIVLGLVGFPAAYHEAEQVEAGGSMHLVMAPFYALAGKWGVFGAMSFGALVLIAIGVFKYRNKPPPAAVP